LQAEDIASILDILMFFKELCNEFGTKIKNIIILCQNSIHFLRHQLGVNIRKSYRIIKKDLNVIFKRYWWQRSLENFYLQFNYFDEADPLPLNYFYTSMINIFLYRILNKQKRRRCIRQNPNVEEEGSFHPAEYLIDASVPYCYLGQEFQEISMKYESEQNFWNRDLTSFRKE
jgi:hypothetical protein